MQDVQYTNSCEGLGDNVRKDGAPRLGIHRFQLSEDVKQLSRRINYHKNVCDFQISRIPKEHPSTDADVA